MKSFTEVQAPRLPNQRHELVHRREVCAVSWKRPGDCPNGASETIHTLTNRRGATLTIGEHYQPRKGNYQSREVMVTLDREAAEALVEYLNHFIEGAKEFEQEKQS